MIDTPPWHPAFFIRGSVSLSVNPSYTVPPGCRAIIVNLTGWANSSVGCVLQVTVDGSPVLGFNIQVSPPFVEPIEYPPPLWIVCNEGSVIQALINLDPTAVANISLDGWLLPN